MQRRAHQVLATAGVVFGMALAVRSAQAQVRGIPVYNSGIATGIAIYGDVGFPNTEAGKGTALAVSGRAGFGPFGATAILSTLNPDGPLIPLSVTLQGGIGYSKPDNGFLPGQEVNELRFPVGVGFALTIPNPALAIKPWIAPRIDIVRSSSGGQSNTESNFGLAGGLELNLLSGLGLHAAYDRVFIDGGDPSVFGLGAHYSFRIPGL